MGTTTATQLDVSHWAMEPSALRALIAQIEAGRAAAPKTPLQERGLTVADGVAQIDIRGVISQRTPWYAKYVETRFASVDRIQADLRAALADPDARTIALVIDSPGGTVAGVDDLAQAVRAAAKKKPVVAVVESMAASAAYWIAAQANTITAPRTATIGSIGVMTVLADLSGMAEQSGVKIHVVASGPDKGIGVPGAPVTDEHLAVVQDEIDALAEIFVSAVSAGRKLPKSAVRDLATGRTWLGSQAVQNGLIDRIGAADYALARAAKEGRRQMTLEQQLADAQASVGKLTADLATRDAQIVALQSSLAARDAEVGRLQGEAKAAEVEARDAYIASLRQKNADLGPTPDREAQIKRVEILLAMKDEAAQALAREMGGEILAAEVGTMPHGLVAQKPRGAQSADEATADRRMAAFEEVLEAKSFEHRREGRTVKYRKPGAEAWESEPF